MLALLFTKMLVFSKNGGPNASYATDTPGPTLKCQVSLHQWLAIIRCVHLHHLETERLYNILWQSSQKLKPAQAEPRQMYLITQHS